MPLAGSGVALSMPWLRGVFTTGSGLGLGRMHEHLAAAHHTPGQRAGRLTATDK